MTLSDLGWAAVYWNSGTQGLKKKAFTGKWRLIKNTTYGLYFKGTYNYSNKTRGDLYVRVKHHIK
jgi:hypothetical protein